MLGHQRSMQRYFMAFTLKLFGALVTGVIAMRGTFSFLLSDRLVRGGRERSAFTLSEARQLTLQDVPNRHFPNV